MLINPNPVGKQKNNYFKSWFDAECRKKRYLKKLLRICKRKNFISSSLSEYDKSKKEYKQFVKRKKTEFKNNIVNEISCTKDSNKF